MKPKYDKNDKDFNHGPILSTIKGFERLLWVINLKASERISKKLFINAIKGANDQANDHNDTYPN